MHEGRGREIIEHVFDKVVGVQSVALLTPPLLLPTACDCVPAGFPSPAQDYFDGDIDLNQHLIHNRPATYVVRIAGDSMMGAGIWDGDEVLVDRSLTPKDGDVVIAVADQELTIKRLRVTQAGPELHPENPSYPVIYPHELDIWGVVTTCLRRVHR